MNKTILFDLDGTLTDSGEGIITCASLALEHFDLAKYFDGICGATLDGSRSTKEDVIEYLIRENGRASHMLMVGDTVYDILGAKAHGIPAIGVDWGYGETEDMINAGAAAIAYDPLQLLERLMTL